MELTEEQVAEWLVTQGQVIELSRMIAFTMGNRQADHEAADEHIALVATVVDDPRQRGALGIARRRGFRWGSEAD